MLFKALRSPSPAAFKGLLNLIKFVLDTKNLCIKLKPIFEKDKNGKLVWNIIVFNDSDCASNPGTRLSICGFVLHFLDVTSSWKSKGAKSVTLSSSEAEFVALSEAAKEAKFVHQVLESMDTKVKLPVIVRVENVGVIFVSNVIAVSKRTKHVNCCLRFANEFVFEELESGFATAQEIAHVQCTHLLLQWWQRHSTNNSVFFECCRL